MPQLFSKRVALGALCTLSTAPIMAQGTRAPIPAAPKSFTLPAKHELVLPNGMHVTLVPYGTLPLATVSLTIRTGAIDEAADQVWLSKLMGDFLPQGTPTLSAAAIAEAAAGMGGTLTVSAKDDEIDIGGDVLGNSAAAFVSLIGDVAQHPIFPDSELKRLTGDRVRALAIAHSQPRQLAGEQYAPLMYPDHPYGRVMPTAGTLTAYTTAAVRAFYAKNVGAARAHLYVLGRFDPDQAEHAAREAFSGWAAGQPPTVNVPVVHAGRRLVVIDRPHAVQSTILLGLRVAEPKNADWIPLNVTNALLGGMFSSRITINIRERKGYTYAPFSVIGPHYQSAAWTETADVTTNVTGPALKEIFGEIDRLRRTSPSADELKGVQNYLAGISILIDATPQGLLSQMSFADLQGLGDDYLSDYERHVYAVTPADVQSIAQRYLDPAKMAIVVAGDTARIAGQLVPYRAVVQ
jgi:zinc protease